MTLASIVSDVATGGTQYLKSTVRMSAQVWLDTITLGNNQGIVLLTDNDTVSFYVIDPDVSDNLTQYAANSTYEFVLFVGSISQDDDGVHNLGKRDKQLITSHRREIVSIFESVSHAGCLSMSGGS